MLTYQDYLRVKDTEADRAKFVRSVIRNHMSSKAYRTAVIAGDYDKCQNTTTMQYQKMITDVTGQQYVDQLATVHRSCSNFFDIIVTQLNQYLLGNGATWDNEAAAAVLGKDFDNRLADAGENALIGGVSYGFFDLNRVRVFTITEFAELMDEETGLLAAGVRFWQIDPNKPLRATFYLPDGFIEYLFPRGKNKPDPEEWTRINEQMYFKPKRPYILTTATTPADGEKTVAGRNYDRFPIIPLKGNKYRQSEIVGLRYKIDAYDFILNGWEDDLDNAQLYWIIKGAGGMDDPDLMQFLDRLKTVKAAAPGRGQEVEPVTVDIPVEARERLLKRLETQIFRDAMVMNPEDIVSGATTATQIKAAYERQNVKADKFEYQVLDFIAGLLEIAGVQASASFTRSVIVNTQEEVTTVIAAAPYVGEEYATKKILTLLGDADQAEAVLKQMAADGYPDLDEGDADE